MSRRNGHMHGGQALGFAEQHNLALAEVLDFSASINPLSPQIDWLQLCNDAKTQIIHYPQEFDSHSRSLLHPLLAETFSIKEDNITLCNGISQAIQQLFASIKPPETRLFTPIYSEYQKAAQAYCNDVREFRGAPQTWLQQAQKLTANSIIVVVNPSTPDGHYYSVQQLLPLCEYCQRHAIWLLVDESFLPFISLEKKFSARQLLTAFPHLIILQSLTKFYACPGIRIGALFSSNRKVTDLIPQTWSLSTIDRLWLQQALQDNNHIIKTQQWLLATKAAFIENLQRLDCIHEVFPSSVNFVLVEFDRPISAVQEHLNAYGMLIRNAQNFGYDANIARIGIKLESANHRLLQALQQIPTTHFENAS
ncbi:aminotransferase class I/II-fold pyridoxal phosphate-dependent enzyme [Thiomicrorhabdus sp. 6S2-11]|uniref:Aminotransferase class I/II-fold pyridoxal phosphate-dependent enzyme n=1 Tax=Thiomicrorhabdus marina TaxID=2818442 RepID=A0ABS3Q3B3_9GAMM|nr:aminotransferase class I/II-fold pyridoxal phosphate-dependent enzyme [Thiomicrorhabdus marina]MBO1926819.1 aminotransferase class I/II-fold pyridoxal phosphate-dependent enzyme [Thiomicrorhabdus marina]